MLMFAHAMDLYFFKIKSSENSRERFHFILLN